jgi:ABC-2 type transport system permease protein
MRYLRLLRSFIAVAFQNVLAYRLNFWISLLHTVLNLGTGILGMWVLFSQVESVQGWTMPSALALLGVYLTLGALRRLFIGPSLEALVGMDGEVWQGTFDFTLLRPVDVQFLASTRHWRPLALLDLVLGLGVLGAAVVRLGHALTPVDLLAFVVALAAGLAMLYAILLAFSALVFWSPGFLFTWLFNALFQMARYPTGFYPGWLRLVLTWIVPVGLMTTIPAQALAGELAPGVLLGSLGLALLFVAGATVLFRTGLRRYASASS